MNSREEWNSILSGCAIVVLCTENAAICALSQWPVLIFFRGICFPGSLARVGFMAKTFRLLFQSCYMEGRPAHSWSAVGLWQEVLPPAFPFTPLQCSRAVAHAQAMARQAWSTECSLFRPGFPPPRIPEEWPTTAWEHPALSASPRADYLDPLTPFPTGADFGIFSDWNLYVDDRSSLFSLLCSLSDAHTPQGVLRSANIPLATRVQTTLQRLKKSWVSPPTALPSWRLHQITRLRSLTSGMSKNLKQSDMSGTVRLPFANLVW